MVLSIVVPVYNVEKYLAECLDSLLCQNVEKNEYEIICIDDKSTDNSTEIIERYIKTNGNIKLIRLPENKGVSAARNAGIYDAKGDYVWFVDSDDFIAPNCLKDIFFSIKSDNADTLFVKPISFKDGIDTSIYKGNDVKEDETTEKYSEWLWTRIIKRKLLTEHNVYFDEGVYLSEDNLFCSVLNKYVLSTCNYDKACYFYRIRENSLSTSAGKEKLNRLIISAKNINEAIKSKRVEEESLTQDVYNYVIMVLFEYSKMPYFKSKRKIKELKTLNVFPLKDYNHRFYEYGDKDNEDQKKLIDLKNKCYTVKGYKRLRHFRFWLKIKRKLGRIFK